MIEFIEIHNFEAWEYLRLDLEQTTTIIGLSDVGKSAALRALRWCCTNEPSGTDFIRWGADTCEVIIGVDGHTVRRVRGKAANSYFLDDTEFKAFGLAVPEPIRALLRLDTGGLNFQQQADAHLWLGVTPSALLAEINRLVDMTNVDTAVNTLAQQHRQAKNELMLADGEYTFAMEQVAANAHGPAQFQLASALVAAADNHTIAAAHLLTVEVATTRATAAATRAANAKAEGEHVRAAKRAGDAWWAAHQQTARIQAAVETAKQSLLTMCFGPPPDQPRDLERANTKWAAAGGAVQRLAVAVRAAKTQAARAATIATQIQQAELELKEIKTCPTCNRPL